MIACVSPADSNLEETISTLRYADRARKIKNKPIVNKDPKAEEIGRLRSQVAELLLKLNGGGGGDGAENDEVIEELTEDNRRLLKENTKLTKLYQTSLEENYHCNEKLQHTEDILDQMKIKLNDISSKADDLLKVLNADHESDFGKLKQELLALQSKIDDLRNDHKKTEESLRHLEISRYDSSSLENPSDNPSDGGDTEEEIQAMLASKLRREADLQSKLSELNKDLAAKQQVVAQNQESEERMKAVKRKYEERLKSMEVELARLQKEKDELCQKQKAEGSAKVSENRRLRIKELEIKISEANKKQIEFQKVIKQQAATEAQAKKFAEEIKEMKCARVKLIKQMKEEGEKTRQWKQAKEKEVYKANQEKKKAQVAMSAMSLKHERKENVLKRKMEESQAKAKRLEMALAKKDDVRKQRAANDQGLVGAGDRVRGWLNTEMELVVSSKEAQITKEGLIQERKVMQEKMNKLSQEMRRTLTESEREEIGAQKEALQSTIDSQNAHISNLQKQIMKADHEREREKEAKVDKWTKVSSMVDAKLALNHLFEEATENMTKASVKANEAKELKIRLKELQELHKEDMEKLETMRSLHNDERRKTEASHQESVQTLIKTVLMKDDDESRNVLDHLDVTSDEKLRLNKMFRTMSNSEVNELQEAKKEIVMLKAQLGNASVFESVGGGLYGKKVNLVDEKKSKSHLKVRRKSEHLTAEEFFDNASDSESEEESSGLNDDDDPEWKVKNTPLMKRLRQERRSMGVGLKSGLKRKDSEDTSDESNDETNANCKSLKKHRSSSALQGKNNNNF